MMLDGRDLFAALPVVVANVVVVVVVAGVLIEGRHFAGRGRGPVLLSGVPMDALDAHDVGAALVGAAEDGRR